MGWHAGLVTTQFQDMFYWALADFSFSSARGAGLPGADWKPTGKSRVGEIRITTIWPRSSLAREGRAKPIRASRYFLGYSAITWSCSFVSATISALPINAGPVREPIQIIAGLPRLIRLAFQLVGEVSIRTCWSAVVMNQTGTALL